mgnify:CR=1 FL=1
MRNDPFGESKAHSPVETDDAQKLIIAMLADIARDPEERQLDHEFIREAISSGQSWSIRWKFPGIFNEDGSADPFKVRAVVRNFQMWSVIESSISRWSPEQKTTYDGLVADHERNPKYHGYDGNHEDETCIARHLVDELDRFSEFSNRAHNAHMRTAKTYGRMEIVFTEIREAMGLNYRDLTPEEVAQIINS